MSAKILWEYIQAYSRLFWDYILDLRFGGYFGGKIKSRFSHLGAYETGSSHYSVLNRIFKKFKVRDSDVLVDVGCGKGRVINYWLKNGCRNKIIGIELDEEIGARTKERFKDYRNVEIIHGDVLQTMPEDATIFYIANSFDKSIMIKFKNRLKELYCKKGVFIYYYNCAHLDAFRGDPDWTIRTNCSFFRNDPELSLLKLDIGTSYAVAILELNRRI